MSYHTIFPTAQKPTYSPTNIVDFKLTFENKKLKANSTRVSGKVKLELTAGNPFAANIAWDALNGAHNLFSEWTTTFESTGIQENLTDYPRHHKMIMEAKNCQEDFNTSSHACALQTPSNSGVLNVFTGMAVADFEIPFSFKPDICINNMSGDLSFNKKSQSVTLQTRLSSLAEVLFGATAAVTNVITITELQVNYETVPEDNKDEPLTMLVLHSVKQVINTGSANINTKVPAVVVGMSASFQLVTHDKVYTHNNYATEDPNVTRVQLFWNDMNNNYISFPLESREEILLNYLQSLNSTGHNDMRWAKAKSDEGFGCGVKFPEPVDLRNQTMGLQIESAITNAAPYYIYIYFQSIVGV